MSKSYQFVDGPRTFNYDIIRHIGRGGGGSVSEAIEIIDGEVSKRPVVVKESACVNTSDEVLQTIAEKLRRIRRIKSPNVTAYYHAKLEKFVYGIETSIQTVVVMEYCPLGDLETYAKLTMLSNDEIKDIIRQILTGLVAIHSHNVIHMDLKTANIVLAHDDRHSRYALVAKITDLDDHYALQASVTKTKEVTSNLKGTTYFMSPEMLERGNGQYQIGRMTDMWSLGCIIVELYRQNQPFRFVNTINGMPNPATILLVDEANLPNAVENFVLNGGIPEIPVEIPDVAKTMMEKCFEKNPNKRLSPVEMLDSGWFENAEALHRPKADTAPKGEANGENQFLLRNKDLIPKPSREMIWDCGVNCAARVLMHHTPHTHFPYHCYATEVAQVKKNIDPGQPVDEKYRRLLLKWLQQSQAPTAIQQNPWATLANTLGSFLLSVDSPRLTALITLMLPTIGPSFPDVARWMNRYTKEYQYVCKGRATWSDIKQLLDRHEPVIAQMSLGDLEFSDTIRQAAALTGYQAMCPTTFPNFHAVVLRGYTGAKPNGEPDRLWMTYPDGENTEMSYARFKKCANWESSHPLTKEAFDLSGYEPGQIIYRVKKEF
ncbi:extracellular signal-regulated kinase 1-like [Paramacrobiotus metropolitanus]|uniref:extracellular signal-regulated kinase 1-like n=1 Tax=Paramacrobiotus metropolitanus TaxID=2943436 RepID=UPI0024462C9C|nr:extracellular signal-regulated kinase 1-like [Paramacrobiotus metropolitanus]